MWLGWHEEWEKKHGLRPQRELGGTEQWKVCGHVGPWLLLCVRWGHVGLEHRRGWMDG